MSSARSVIMKLKIAMHFSNGYIHVFSLCTHQFCFLNLSPLIKTVWREMSVGFLVLWCRPKRKLCWSDSCTGNNGTKHWKKLMKSKSNKHYAFNLNCWFLPDINKILLIFHKEVKECVCVCVCVCVCTASFSIKIHLYSLKKKWKQPLINHRGGGGRRYPLERLK